MAKVEFTCSENFKKDLKKVAEKRSVSVASFVKDAVYEKINRVTEVTINNSVDTKVTKKMVEKLLDEMKKSPMR